MNWAEEELKSVDLGNQQHHHFEVDMQRIIRLLSLKSTVYSATPFFEQASYTQRTEY